MFLRHLLFWKKTEKASAPVNECNFCHREIEVGQITAMTKPNANFYVSVCPACVSRAKENLGFIEAGRQEKSQRIGKK